MARKQAQRRKTKTPARRVAMPSIRIGRIVTPLLAVAAVLVTYQLSARMLDRPIDSLQISGPFQRVSALRIEEAISDDLDAGFLGADLDTMRGKVQALPWIDQASVARRWPNRVAIAVTEQVPAAAWDERGLLNTRGELFLDEARHIPAELPRLSGPADRAADVAKRYLLVRERLIPLGLDLRRIHLDPRGAWEMTLANGVNVRLGRRDVEPRTQLFVDVVASIITNREAEIDYVDMRYSNGFTIGWKDGLSTPIADPQSSDQEMLARRISR